MLYFFLLFIFYFPLLVSENILELGSGTAIAAIMCLKRNAKVTVQELPDVLPHTLHCLKMNNVTATKIISSFWGEKCIKEALNIDDDILIDNNNNSNNSHNSNSNDMEVVINDDDYKKRNEIICNIFDDNKNKKLKNRREIETEREIEVETDVVTSNNIKLGLEIVGQTEKKSFKKKRKKSFETKKVMKIVNNTYIYHNIKNQCEKSNIKLFDRIIMADVLYHTEDFVPLITTIMNTISLKGVVIICYEQRRKDLNFFFDLLIPLFHCHDKHTIVIESKIIIDNDSNNNNDGNNKNDNNDNNNINDNDINIDNNISKNDNNNNNNISIDNNDNDNNNNNNSNVNANIPIITTFHLHVLRSKISEK